MANIKSGDFAAAAADLNTCLDHGYLRDSMRECIETLSKGTLDDGKKLLAKYNKLVSSRQQETEAKEEK